jgi:hypothetical protein
MAGAVRIGTRGRPLARRQAEWVARQLRLHHPDRDVALVEIKSRGDRDQDSPLAAIGGIDHFALTTANPEFNESARAGRLLRPSFSARPEGRAVPP